MPAHCVGTAADGAPAPDIMPHPLIGYEPLAASGPLAFTREKAEFVGQIAHLAQKSGYRVVEQRIYYCPRIKDLPDDADYPPWDGVNMSTSTALYNRFPKAVTQKAEASSPISMLFEIKAAQSGYVLLSGYYLPRSIGGGALIANTILDKT